MSGESEDNNNILNELEHGGSNFTFIKNPKDNFAKTNIAEAEDDDDDFEEMVEKYGEEFAKSLEERRKNGWTEWEVNGSTLRHYGGNLKHVEIPDGITEIEDGAFSGTGFRLESVIVPEGVKIIGERAFAHCDNLKKIVLPDSLETLGNRAFLNCGYLKSVVLGNGLREIGNGAFWLCSNLKRIKIPKSVKRIGDYAFEDCIRLIEASIDDAECSIGKEAFRHCDFWHIYLGENVTEIGDNAFSDSELVNLTIPESVKKIGEKIFDGCEEFIWAQCMAKSKPQGWHSDWNKNSFAKGGRVKAVWNWGFTNGVIPYYDKSLFYIEGNKLKKYLGNGGEVVIPDGVYSVKEDAFRDCSKIEKLTVPASLKKFEDGLWTVHIKTLCFLGTFKEWQEIYWESDVDWLAEEIYVEGKRIK